VSFSFQVKKLALAGGFKGSDTVRRVFGKVVASDVAWQFSMEGRKGKLAFRQTEMMKAVRSSTHMSVTTTDMKIERSLRELLKHAKASVPSSK